MDHRIPKVGVTVGVICAVIAAITFVFLNEVFEGPSVTGGLGGGYELEAVFEDTEILPTKQPVLLRGLRVGKVKGVEFNKEDSTATVRFSVDDDYAPVYRNATAAVGERTILGDPYLRLEPGDEPAGEVESGGTIEAVQSVDFDEALAFLDEQGQRHVRSILDELERATRSDSGPERLNNTLGGLTRTVTQVRSLTDALRGQEDDLAGLVSDSATVLDELGSREQAIRTIVASGRTTLDALAAHSEALEAGLAEVPGVLESASDTLASSRPLLAEARPLIAELREVVPELDTILTELPSAVTDTVEIVGQLSGVPTMRELLKVVRLVGPSVPGIEATARNLVPLIQYTAARTDEIGGYFAKARAATQSRDSIGHWIRTAAVFDDELGMDSPSTNCPMTICFNAFPEPGDAANPQPGSTYPRLEPFDPPPPP